VRRQMVHMSYVPPIPRSPESTRTYLSDVPIEVVSEVGTNARVRGGGFAVRPRSRCRWTAVGNATSAARRWWSLPSSCAPHHAALRDYLVRTDSVGTIHGDPSCRGRRTSRNSCLDHSACDCRGTGRRGRELDGKGQCYEPDAVPVPSARRAPPSRASRSRRAVRRTSTTNA